MDKIKTVKSQLRMQAWAERISECQASSTTVAAWCEANGINIKTYYYWLRIVRAHTLEHAPALTENLPVKSEKQPVVFKQLEVQPPVSGIHNLAFTSL